jgi:hypothetical protein
MVVDPDTFSWFRQRVPVARPGNGIFVYEVAERAPRPNWVAQCTVPVAPLTQDVLAEGFGRDDLRVSFFDCTQSWLFPSGGSEPGAYVFHNRVLSEHDAFDTAYLEGASLSYEQRADRLSPAFSIFAQPAGSLPARCAAESRTFEGPLTLLGYRLSSQEAQPRQAVEVETCWRVAAVPQRPLSLMLHLIGPQDAPVVVGDGLGVPTEVWRVDDVIIQRHRLTLPTDAPDGEYRLYTGAYWLDTLERWSVLDVRGLPAGDHVSLPSIQVTASR